MSADTPNIHVIRGFLVMLDEDVARSFDVRTGRLNEQVKRNAARFEDDFVFQLSDDEWESLRSQNATAKPGRGGRRVAPWAYTEHGVVMAATLLRSEQAVAASKLIVRTFVAARRNEMIQPAGLNSQLAIDMRDVLPTQPGPPSDGTGKALAHRASTLVARILDTIANDEEGTTVREESRTIIAKSLGAIRAHLDAKGIDNEKTVTEIRKLMAEIEAIDADVIARSIEADHRRLAYLAKQLQLVIGLETYLERGEAEAFLSILRGLSGD